MQSDNDSLTKLIEDVESATEANFYACAYFGQKDDECNGCPAHGKPCYKTAFSDIARRLHVLMPHDSKGVEIKPSDTIENQNGEQDIITDVLPFPAIIRDGGAEVTTFALPNLWSVVQPDSWERLEEDATMLPHDYLTAKDTSDKRYGTEALTAMTTDLLLRAKRLAGVEQ